MSGPISGKCPAFRRFAIGILLTITVSACSQGEAQRSSGPGGPASGISFGLVWQRSPLPGATAQFSPVFNACVDHAIDTVAATVTAGANTVASGSWPCSTHEGLIFGVPAGTNYTVQVDGKSSGATTWSGQASGIAVTSGQIADAGIIVMAYTGTDTTNPAVTSIYPASSTSSTTNVPVTARINIAFSELMAPSSITTNNIALKLIDNSPLSGTMSYDAAGSTAAFTPSAALAYNTQYVLEVISCLTPTCITDTAGNQLASDYTSAFTTESEPVGAPAAPSGAAAKPGNGQVTVDWLAANGAASYNVYYGTSPGITLTNGVKISDARAPFVHIGLTNNQTYYYLVTSVNSIGETPAAAETSATPINDAANPNVPSPPASLAAAPGISKNFLTWPAAARATAYSLYWSTTPITPDITAAENVIRYIACNTDPCSLAHTGLTGEQTYYYIVTATNSFGEGAGSPQAAAAPASTGSSGSSGF